jgi:hypothetical protein
MIDGDDDDDNSDNVDPTQALPQIGPSPLLSGLDFSFFGASNDSGSLSPKSAATAEPAPSAKPAATVAAAKPGPPRIKTKLPAPG